MNNVLFVIEKWCDGKPELPLSTSYHHIYNTFVQSQPEYHANVIYFDEAVIIYGKHVDNFLVTYCKEYNIKFVFISLLATSSYNPSILVLEQLKNLGIKICLIWPDTGPGWSVQMMNQLAGIADLHASVDNPYYIFTQPLFPKNHCFLWVPQDENLFRPDEQDVDISFIGSTRSYFDRQNFLWALKSIYPQLVISGGQRENKLTFEQYAKAIRRSKININFSTSLGGFYQTKSRVMEVIASRTMLFELDNEATKQLFTDGVDYVSFSTANDLILKINSYLKHNERRLEIASNGYNIFRQKYTAKHFWDVILHKLL
jgi:glycosyltransferase involved in cell wall biosynthesis